MLNFTNMKTLKSIFFTLLIFAFVTDLYGQTSTKLSLSDARPISTAVPFLTITPDARAGSMGDLGVATSPDVYSIYWNSAKYAFLDQKMGVGLSYTPWLHSVAQGISLSQLVGFYRLNDRQSFAASVRYFTVGEIQLTNELGQEISVYKPNEFAIDAAYAMKLGDHFAGSIALRFIYSNITGGISTAGIQTKPGVAFAGDLGFYYKNDYTLSGKQLDVNAGVFMSNLGSKISYSDATLPSFIPANLRIGTWLNYHLNELNSLAWGIDFNKLLVPTPPIRDNEGNIIAGKDISDMSVIAGIFNSLYYAPLGFREKLAEITVSTGMEYNYKNLFFARLGYFYESPYKGDRQYMTAGLGLKYSSLGLDFSYLIPVNRVSPLDGTVRISLTINLGSHAKPTQSAAESQQK